MQWTTDEILQTLCRTFLHSLWQGMIAATAAGLLLLLTRRTNARIRYNLLGCILLLFVLCTVVTFCYELPAATSELPEIIGLMTMPTLPMQWDERMFQYLDQHAMPIVAVWMLVFLFKCTRLAGGFMQIRRIRRNAHPANAQWQQQLQILLQQLGIKHQVQLLESAMVKVPLTLGTLKPCIYVPAGLLLQLPADQVETIFLHELAHIRRKDYLVNILQSFAETIFFFNPPLLWISAHIREEREACCDDIVLAHTTHHATYVQALLAFQEGSLQPQLGVALQGKHYHLYNRVKRMLTRENQKLSIMEKTMLITGLIAVTAFSLMPGLEQPAIAAPIQVQKETRQLEKITFQPAEIHFSPKNSAAGNRKDVDFTSTTQAGKHAATTESEASDTTPPPPPEEVRFIALPDSSPATQNGVVFSAESQNQAIVVFHATDTQPGNRAIFKAKPVNTTTPKEIRFKEKMTEAKEIGLEEKTTTSGKVKSITFKKKMNEAEEIRFEEKMTTSGNVKSITFEGKRYAFGKAKEITFESETATTSAPKKKVAPHEPKHEAKVVKFPAPKAQPATTSAPRKSSTPQEPKPAPEIIKFPAPQAKPAPAAPKKEVRFPLPAQAQQPEKKSAQNFPDKAIQISPKGEYKFIEWKENGKIMHAELGEFRKSPGLQASLKSSIGEKKYAELIRDMPQLTGSDNTPKANFPKPKARKQSGPNGIPDALYKNMNISKPQHC